MTPFDAQTVSRTPHRRTSTPKTCGSSCECLCIPHNFPLMGSPANNNYSDRPRNAKSLFYSMGGWEGWSDKLLETMQSGGNRDERGS